MPPAAKIVILALMAGIASNATAQQSGDVITLQRSVCFGPCPAYVLIIDSSGVVSFRLGPPFNHYQERSSRISTTQFADLMAEFTLIHFFELDGLFPPTHTDGQQTRIEVSLAGKKKAISHFENGPPELLELERKMEVLANTHQWLHRATGPLSRGEEDLKNQMFVREDVYTGIKPGMTLLMRAAGRGNLEAIQSELMRGEEVSASDETGWTALMVAAVMGQNESVLALVKSHAPVDQQDRNGDTALLGASAVRFGDLEAIAKVARTLLSDGASIEAVNDRGETALMWAAEAGNPELIQVLLKARADPARVDQSGHDALFYLKNARATLGFNPSFVRRYDRAESILTGN